MGDQFFPYRITCFQLCYYEHSAQMKPFCYVSKFPLSFSFLTQQKAIADPFTKTDWTLKHKEKAIFYNFACTIRDSTET